jgi:mono/diheme cytochrome c family protein
MIVLDLPRVFPPRRAMRRATTAAALALALSVPAAAQDSAVGKAPRLLSKGAYTQAQSSRGEAAYKTSCVSCHSAKEYTGDAFRVAWLSRTAFDLFDRIKTLMPDDNPGILPRQEYVDIVAYMFSLNGYPAGADELPDDDEALKLITIDSIPAGARPDTHGRASARLLRRQLAARR